MLLLGGLLWVFGSATALAQSPHPAEAAIDLLERGRAQEALPVLLQSVSDDPLAVVPGRGPVALWLGRAYERTGQPDRAATVYGAALRAGLTADGALPSFPLLSAYARSFVEGHGDALLLQRAYLAALAAAPRYVDAHAEDLTDVEGISGLAGHLLLMERIGAELPGAVRERGPAAVAWWHEQDLLPADELNPRLVEHLRRLAVAQRDYPSTTTTTGLDDRGLTYLRYGPPRRLRSVRLDQLPQGGFRSLGILPSELRENEVWLYDELDPNAVFLFVRERRRSEGYREADVNALVPRPMQTRGTSLGGHRADALAQAGLSLLAHVYQDLALLHSSYAARAAQVSDYATWVYAAEDQVPIGLGTQQRARAARTESLVAGLGLGFTEPTSTLGRMLDRNAFEDERLRQRRDDALPTDHVPELEGRVRPLDVLAARFLDEQGQTRLRLLWRGLPLADAQPSAAGNETLERIQHARLVRLLPTPGQRLPVLDTLYVAAGQTLAADLPLEPAAATLALQLDEIVVLRSGGEIVPGAGMDAGSGVWRSTLLPPLGLRPEGLELSDLIPFEVQDVVTTRTLLREDFGLDALRPTLPMGLEDRDALGIYFEIYDQAGQHSDYFIEYEVVARRAGSLLRRSREDTRTFQALRVLEEPRRPAAFLIDRSQWQGSDEVEVTVRMTDPDSDVTIVRTLSFSTRGE